MLSIKKCPVVEHPPDTLEIVRKTFNLHQPGRMDESIDRLQEWVKSQPHFNKKDFSRDFLEIFIINNKGSVEKAKQRLERHCAIKTFGKKFFTTEVAPIDLDDLEGLYSAPLPKLTKDFHRVYLLRNTIEHYGPNIVKNYCLHTIFFLESMIKYDYNMGTIIIFDWRKTHLLKLAPLTLREETHHLLEILLKGYQLRIHNLHIISDSKIVETILSAVKTVVSPKVLSRVVIHKTLDTLYNYVDKDLLCSDYGGKEKSLIEVATNCNKFLSTKDFIDYCKDSFEATIDTSKKPKAEYNEIFFGMAGTFRTLHID